MGKIKALPLILMIAALLSSCTSHVSGFALDDRQIPDAFGGLLEIFPVYARANVPTVEIDSPCDGVNYTFLSSPSSHYHYNHKKASIYLYITAPPKMLDWDTISIKLTLANKLLVPADVVDTSDERSQRRRYFYEAGVTCGQLDGMEVTFAIDGAPIPISSKVTYKHQWRLLE